MLVRFLYRMLSFWWAPIGWMVCLWEDRRAYRKRDGENHLRTLADPGSAGSEICRNREPCTADVERIEGALFSIRERTVCRYGSLSSMGFGKSLFNYKLFNHFIVDYYIAYRNSNMIVSPRKVYTVDQYYRMRHYDDQPLSEWKQALFGQYHYKTYAPGHSVVYEGNLTRLSATCNPSGIKEATEWSLY